ncbi:hypothetical protein [Frateuria defendens]|uniref:hypothetical protein n=1 Tax=Frateuria defendens TaxID=2219559 RepID=UPI00066FE9A2|nr:hypothetical protein [Frateuria defendens]
MTATTDAGGITVRYCGYLIRCRGESFTVTLAGDEVIHQTYPGTLGRLGRDALGPWMLDQAKAYVDARRAGAV